MTPPLCTAELALVAWLAAGGGEAPPPVTGPGPAAPAALVAAAEPAAPAPALPGEAAPLSPAERDALLAADRDAGELAALRAGDLHLTDRELQIIGITAVVAIVLVLLI